VPIAAAIGQHRGSLTGDWGKEKQERKDMNARDEDGPPGCEAEPAAMSGREGLLLYRGRRINLCGRALKLALWIAHRQQRINETAPLAGQLWLSWKGDGPNSIGGDIKVPL
jgi:hypothetical protein